VKKCFSVHLILLLAFSVFMGCTPINNSKYYEYLSQKYEVEICDTDYNYTQTTTLTGTAQFYKRGINVVVETGKLKNMYLGNPTSVPLPIRFAEVAVYDWTNKIIQCGRTDDSGFLKALDGTSDLKIPKKAGDYTVRVFSRINKTFNTFMGKPDFDVNVAVKRDIYTNELYFISAVASSNGTDDSSVNLTAFARQSDSLEVEGGAFNILNSLYTAYDYINNNTSTVNTTCLNEKLNVYWKLGFNPLQYYYPEKKPETLSPNSFYLEDGNQLFISGGRLGNINLERTDHFGDYVIIHELGHHIESVCGSLLSPGGDHYLISRQDPRLVWAEGWANYFAAKVINNKITQLDPDFTSKISAAGLSDASWTYFFGSVGFTDTFQNIGNGTGFMFDLKKEGKNPDSWQWGSLFGIAFDQVDPNRYLGEGHFREGAITRGLFKLSTSCETAACINKDSLTPIPFSDMWRAMDKITGIGDASIYPYKSSAQFLEVLKKDIVGTVSWTTLSASSTSYATFNAKNTSEALHIVSDNSFRTVSTSSDVHTWRTYGERLYTTGSSLVCSIGRTYIEPRSDDPFLTSVNSDQRYSNHNYLINELIADGVDEIRVSFFKRDNLVTNVDNGTNTEFDLVLFQGNYFFNGDYTCVTKDSNGQCTAYNPSRGVTSNVVKSDRRAGPITTKVISGLNLLDRSIPFLLNIRAYTANRSISTNTNYEYIITDRFGNRLCP
jgi:hypothetical protein